jgi:S-DNA-T family DNA segregation ATPase FtsK/SpoIIIE
VWDALAGPHEPGTLLLFDDFDSVHARWEPDYQAVALERLSGILRDGHSAGVHVAVAVQRLTAALHPVQALFQSTLVMGLPDRQEHRTAGGADALFEPALPPGGGTWKGLRIQLLTEWPSVSPSGSPSAPGSGAGSGEAHRHPREPVPALEPANNHPLLVVSGAPTRTAARLRSAIRRPGTVIELSGTATGTGAGAAGRIELTDATGGTIFVGDPDSWQAHWPLLTALRSRADLVFDRCSLSEYRLISRRRDLPPVLVPGGSQVWVLRPDGEVTRATLPV